jgi:lysophospholipase L1-like esterase
VPGLVAALAALAALLAAMGATDAGTPARLTLDYRVPPRYGLPVDVSPRTWTALVTVRWPRGGPCTGTYSWTIDGRPAAFVRRKDAAGRPTCAFSSGGFARLDRPYRVAVSATRSGAHADGRTTVTVRDRLIVGLGDSFASGEGNPDHAGDPVRWQDRRCHRSANGFEALVAARLEVASARSSVTYVPLACSGASITAGLLGPYAGIEPVGSTTLPPQVSAMKSLIDKRVPDAVIVSIGINDLGFGNVAFFCFDDGVDAKAAASVDCWNRHYPSASSAGTLTSFVRGRVAALPGRLARLADAFRAAGVPASRIYVTEYPNATRDANGRTCDPLIPYLDGRAFGTDLRGEITRDEAAKAETELLLPVNHTLADAASVHGWHFVSGIAAASARHGVCSTRPWFLSVFDSFLAQHDVLGTLHPNAQGQQATAGLVTVALGSSG